RLCGSQCCVLQRANDSCADGQDGASGITSSLDAIGRLFRNFVALRMHHVPFERFTVNWLKRAEPDVQRKFADLRATPANFLQNFSREVETRSGSGNCSGTLGKNSLIALAV